jgi:[ribosomal protein S5]-alanine N-acetyltransferase
MLDTERLIIMPLSPEELSIYLQADGKLEMILGLTNTGRVVSPEVRSMVEQITIPKMMQAVKEEWLFITFWIAVEKLSKTIVAELGFKGVPNPRGFIEIGYGTMPIQRNKGYMTEAVSALIGWAKTQQQVRGVLAETNESNLGSIRVVEKNNFRRYGRKDKMILWKIAFP